jgi:PTS system fructose-specific IIC component
MQRWDLSRIQIVCPEVTARDKEGVIRELAETLRFAFEVGDLDRFVEDVLSRESLLSTGVGDGIAVPHARTRAVHKFVMVFGRSREGVDFGAPDGKPARLIFLMGIPKSALRGYLNLLKVLSAALKEEPLRRRLLEASGREEILRIFCQEAQAGQGEKALLSSGAERVIW